MKKKNIDEIYKNLFDEHFNNFYLDLCNYPINILNYLCISNCSK